MPGREAALGTVAVGAVLVGAEPTLLAGAVPGAAGTAAGIAAVVPGAAAALAEPCAAAAEGAVGAGRLSEAAGVTGAVFLAGAE